MKSYPKLFRDLLSRVQKLLIKPDFIAFLVVTFFTFFSRFLGYVRQFLIISRLEPSQSDLLISANKLPEFISVFLLMGTVYSSVLPIASKLTLEKGDKETSKYLNLVGFLLGGIILLLSLIAFIWAEPFLLAFTSQENINIAKTNNLWQEYVNVARILLVIPIAFALQSIYGVFITIKKNFLVYSLAGVIANFGSIGGLLLANGSITTVAIGMVSGWIVTNVVFLIQAKFSGYSFAMTWKFWENRDLFTELKQTIEVFLPRIFLIDGFFAAQFLINPIAENSGVITAFDLGTSISGAFFSVVTSLVTVLFPDLSATFHDKNLAKSIFWTKLKNYLIITLFLGFGANILSIIGAPLILWLYRILDDSISEELANYTILLAQISATSLVFRALRETLSKYLFVRQRQWEPVFLSCVALFGQILFTNLLKQMQIDSGINVSLGLIIYNLVWILFMSWILWRDRRIARGV